MPKRDLGGISSFESLCSYLEEELDWRLEGYQFDDLTFAYEPEELGLKDEDAAKVRKILQMRPLRDGQPWGIFFIEFEKKKLPVVVLRRILSSLVIKKRASANKADRTAFKAEDLLFITRFGEANEPEIAFAHFNQGEGDLPALRVLGWDGKDTLLKIEHVTETLKSKLRWPEHPSDSAAWRAQWASVFRHRVGHVIKTSDALAETLATLAQHIRDAALTLIDAESERGQLRKLFKAFKTALIHDLDEESFADTYAQTITYGLLTAAISRTEMSEGRHGTALIADNVADIVPVTNPFLKEMLATFLKAGGRKGGINFDDLGTQDVVELLRGEETDLPAIIRDFGNRTSGEDPVSHFYEHFLGAYNKELKNKRGVFYTPRPVVSYIVRSVDELLKTEFSLEDGLASTVTWGEMKKRSNLQIPDGVDPKSLFVQVLDPATGTATFLVEVIEVIHQHLQQKWKKGGLKAMPVLPPSTFSRQAESFETYWNLYVPLALLPRLHGYELMMAPYAIAHMKIGLKLFETGYRFGSGERARIYLTNALEPATDSKRQKEFEELAPALAHEAQAVNEIKRRQRFTVVIGNPPWSGHSWNLSPDLRRIVEPYRYVHKERIKEKGALQLEKSIQDDYIKFMRTAQLHIEKSSVGLTGMVTSHGFLDNPFLRGMRSSVLSTFGKLFVLDLHGNALRGDKSPDGGADKNVFDIQRTGVAVSFFRRLLIMKTADVQHAGIWGERNDKYHWLMNHSALTTPAQSLSPKAPTYLLIRQDATNTEEYKKGYSIGEIMPVNSKGVVTGRDAFDLDFDKEALIERMQDFVNPTHTDDHLIEKYDLNPSDWWDVRKARAQMPKRGQLHQFVRPLLYRPFDIRPCFYHPAVLMSPRRPVMKHLDPGHQNILLVTSKMTKGEPFAHVTVSDGLAEAILLSSKTSNNAIVFPLYLYPDQSSEVLALEQTRQPNFTQAFLRQMRSTLGVATVDGRGDFEKSVGVQDIFDYMVAVLHSPTFRRRYVDELSRDFPHIPLTGNLELTRALVILGGELVALHLLDSPKLEKHITEFIGSRRAEIEQISRSKNTVWLDKLQTTGFKGVSEAVWKFHIGGYQVCEKWLKDRKGRTLSKDDVEHYHRIVVALSETIRLMEEIDKVIDKHGGWPGAFSTAARAN